MTSFYHSKKFVFFLERSELSRIGVIRINPSTEKKSFNYFSSLNNSFARIKPPLSFFLATRLGKQNNDGYLKALHWGNEGHHA